MITEFFKKIALTLWGDLSKDEYKKFGILSFTLFFILASYWLMRPLKDSLFGSIVGIEYQPRAKFLTFLFLIPMVLIYSKLVDTFEKHRLFYIMCFSYFIFFLGIAFLLKHPTIGLQNTVTSPSRILGWTIYVGIESFGSLMVALFWSFVASTTKTESAKKGYALILAGAQIGSITGPTLARYAPEIGTGNLMFFVTIGIIFIPFIIKYFMNVVPMELQDEKPTKSAVKKPTGPLEGLKLILTRPYIAGVFVVATIFEIVGTILDYQMKVLAFKTYVHPDARTAFLGLFGQLTNGLTLFLAIFGVSILIRKFGITVCLLIFPISMVFIMSGFYLKPILIVALVGMVLFKSLSYALNNASKEILYIPTSKDIKFKAKSWIDAFGSRSSKASGAIVTNFFRATPKDLMLYGTLISLGVIGVWIVVAMFVGKTFNKLNKEKRVIE